MSILADLVRLFHIFIIAFVVVAPFINNTAILVLHITFCFSLLVHWSTNSNVCSLSVFESKLRGLDYTQSLTHQFIAPVYDVSQTQWSTFCTLATIVLMFISAKKLYDSGIWSTVKSCYNDNKEKGMSWAHNVAECLMPIFAGTRI